LYLINDDLIEDGGDFHFQRKLPFLAISHLLERREEKGGGGGGEGGGGREGGRKSPFMVWMLP